MNPILLLIICVTIIIIIAFIHNKKYLNILNEKYGYYCKNCNRNEWMGERDCASCVNCGWCINPNGVGSCGVGTPSGPMFKDCRTWYHQGKCMWGPECNYGGPIYTVPVRNYPSYIRWPRWRLWNRYGSGRWGLWNRYKMGNKRRIGKWVLRKRRRRR